MKLKISSFSYGGINIEKAKFTASAPIIKSHMPVKVVIPMSEYNSRPARITVNEGQNVEEGQVIGEPEGFNSAYVHASVSGKVTSVEPMIGWDGHETGAVTIMTGGIIKNWYGKKYDISNMTVMQMLSDIRQAGIIGMDGNGISADIKLTPKKGRKINTIIINGAESSPYLTVDHSLLLEKTDEILTGIRLIMKITGAHEAIIGIEANNTEALNALSGKLGGESSISLGVLGNKYPQGMERLLIRSLFNKEIPSTHSPDDIGVIIENVTTVYAVYEAIIYKKPLIERCITYTGDDVENRGNYKIRIGTPISLITGEFGLPVKPGRIIASDAMTGYDVTGNDMPVTKGTAGIIILPKKREYRVRNMSCIRCSRCLFACPMKLNPSELLWLCGEELIDEALSAGLNECIECGCCSYSCPSTIPIAAVIRYGKNKVEGKGGNI